MVEKKEKELVRGGEEAEGEMKSRIRMDPKGRARKEINGRHVNMGRTKEKQVKNKFRKNNRNSWKRRRIGKSRMRSLHEKLRRRYMSRTWRLKNWTRMKRTTSFLLENMSVGIIDLPS